MTSSCLVTGPFLDAVHLAELLEPEREMCIKRKNTDIIFIVIVDVVVIIVNSIVLIIDNNIITIIIYIYVSSLPSLEATLTHLT